MRHLDCPTLIDTLNIFSRSGPRYVFILAVIVFLADRKGTRYMLGFVGNIPYGDKLGHFCLMGGFSLLLNLVLNAKTIRLLKINFLL